MFNFDMLVHGVRGADLLDTMSPEELEVYGVDWEALRDDRLLHSQQINNEIHEEATSWVGQRGPPADLNEVRVDSPPTPIDEEGCLWLRERLAQWLGRADDNSVISAWSYGLAYARQLNENF